MAAAPAGEQAAPEATTSRGAATMSERPPEAPPGDQAPPPPPPPIEPRPAAAAPGPAPGMVRRLTRRTDNKMLAGVASGIAAYLGIEPWIVRIGFVILVPFGGFGALAYLIAWLLVPVEGSQQSLAGDVLRRPPSGIRGYLGVALILLAVAILASAFSEPGVIWAIVLIAFGVFLFRQDDPAEAADRRPPPGGGPGPGAVATTTPLPAASPDTTTTEPLGPPPAPGQGAIALPPDVPVWEPPPPPPDRAAAWGAPPPRRPRRRPFLGPLTFAVALIV